MKVLKVKIYYLLRKIIKRVLIEDDGWSDNWRRNNLHNHTSISNLFLPESKSIFDIVKVGNGTY